MAWTAEKLEKGTSNGNVYVKVRFTDGVQSFVHSYVSGTTVADWPDVLIRARLAELDGQNLATIDTGAPKSAPAPVPPPEPTKEETDKRAYFDAINKLTELKKAQSHKAPVNPLTISDLETFIAANYKAEYY